MPTMSGSTTSGYTVTASTEDSASGHYGWDAFDKSTGINNKWYSSNTAATLTIQLPNNLAVAGYRVTSPNESGQANRSPANWTFEGSMDGSTWVVLDTQTGVTSWTHNQNRDFQFSNVTAYLYYRLNVTATAGASALAVGEMQLYAASCSGADDLGNHEAAQNLNMSTFDIIGTGDVSVSTLNATQLCDEDGANCTDLSDGISSASALASLTDVSASAPSEGQLLSYDASESEWVAKDVISETIILNSADVNACVVTGGVRKLSFNPSTGRLQVCRP
jgi:hypothetical protein